MLVISQAILSVAHAQTATIIPANEATAHVGEYATVEGVVAKMFTSKAGNTFLNIGASYSNQTFTGWIPPASPCLGQRWPKILWKMWQTRTPYDAELHQKNQLRHGSWVLTLQNA